MVQQFPTCLLGVPDLIPVPDLTSLCSPCLFLVTLTMTLSEGEAGMETLIAMTLEASHGVDAATMGTEAGLGLTFIFV